MSRKDDMVKYYGFYDGDLEVVYADFKSRRVSSTAIDNDNVIAKEDFTFRNHIRLLVDKLVNYLPTSFEFEAFLKDSDEVNEKITADIKQWLEGPYFGGGKTFWEMLPGIYKTPYVYGTAYLMAFVQDGIVNTQKMYSEDVIIVVNPENIFDIQKIIFEWEKVIEDGDGGEETVTMKMIITSKDIQTFQDDNLLKKTNHKWGRIPVVILKHEEVDGSEYGESLIKKLIEPQQDINYASTMRQRANKMNSFRVYCPRDAEDGRNISGEVKVSPGRLFKIPIDVVGGDINLSSIENEIEDYVEEIHNLANVPRKKRLESLSGNPTATEINMIMKDLTEASRRYLTQCKKAFEELFELYYLIQNNGTEIDVRISYQDMDIEDKEWQKWMIDWLARYGYLDEAMRNLGYKDEDLKRVKDEKAKADAEDQVNYEREYQQNQQKFPKEEEKEEEKTA